MSAKDTFAALLQLMSPSELSELRDVMNSIPTSANVNVIALAEEVRRPRPAPYDPQKGPRPIGPRLYRELIGDTEPPTPTPPRKPRRRRLRDIVNTDEQQAQEGLLPSTPSPSAAPTSEPRSASPESRPRQHPQSPALSPITVPKRGPNWIGGEFGPGGWR